MIRREHTTIGAEIVKDTDKNQGSAWSFLLPLGRLFSNSSRRRVVNAVIAEDKKRNKARSR